MLLAPYLTMSRLQSFGEAIRAVESIPCLPHHSNTRGHRLSAAQTDRAAQLNQLTGHLRIDTHASDAGHGRKP